MSMSLLSQINAAVESKARKSRRESSWKIQKLRTDGKKYCKGCDTWKVAVEEFRVARHKKDGVGLIYRSLCREC